MHRSLCVSAAQRDLLADPLIHLLLDPAHSTGAQLDGFWEGPLGQPHVDGVSCPVSRSSHRWDGIEATTAACVSLSHK